jgi:hypothetical protein
MTYSPLFSTYLNLTPCSPVEVLRRFGGTYCIHLQGRRVKAMLSLVIKHYVMKTYEKSGGIAPPFLTSALYGGKWSASRTSRSSSGERAPLTHWIGGWVGPGPAWTLWSRENSHVPAGNWTPAVQSVARDYTDWAIPAPGSRNKPNKWPAEAENKQSFNCLLSLLFDFENEAVRSSETSVNLHRTPRCHIQEGNTLLEQESPTKERRHEQIVDPNCIMESQGGHKNEGVELMWGAYIVRERRVGVQEPLRNIYATISVPLVSFSHFSLIAILPFYLGHFQCSWIRSGSSAYKC